MNLLKECIVASFPEISKPGADRLRALHALRILESYEPIIHSACKKELANELHYLSRIGAVSSITIRRKIFFKDRIYSLAQQGEDWFNVQKSRIKEILEMYPQLQTKNNAKYAKMADQLESQLAVLGYTPLQFNSELFTLFEPRLVHTDVNYWTELEKAGIT